MPKTTMFQVEMAGYWVLFSTNNNSTSLFDHWLLYRHCAKLKRDCQVENQTKVMKMFNLNQCLKYVCMYKPFNLEEYDISNDEEMQ